MDQEYSVRLPPPFPFPLDIDSAPIERISLEKLKAGDADESQKLFDACKKIGCFHLDLRNETQGEAIMNDADALIAMSKEFFALSFDEKQRYELVFNDIGYKYKGKAPADENKEHGDRNEWYSICRDDILNISKHPRPQPDIIIRNKGIYKTFTEQAHDISLIILSHLNTHLHLAPNFLESRHEIISKTVSNVRLIHIEPQAPNDVINSFPAHYDRGTLTILFQVLGGLEIVTSPESSLDSWKPVKPQPGCALVSVGNSLMNLTGNAVKSVYHKVTAAPGEQGTLSRYTVGYFLRPVPEDMGEDGRMFTTREEQQRYDENRDPDRGPWVFRSDA